MPYNTPISSIVTSSIGRGAELKYGPGNNQYARASDVNPIIDYIDARASVNTVSASGVTSVTINALNGTATFTPGTAINGAGATQAVTVNDSNVTSTSQVQGVITAYSGTGIPVIAKTVCTAGVITFTVANVHPTVGNTVTSVTISFIVL